ncbi:MAG TPA: TadE/TadG family type IV pilus assembly protein [Pyrinomonadaceae bacterium]|nr:TadE/TadG family type IV pilus assembly protein [Pyrinomonadaceae bacterium]
MLSRNAPKTSGLGRFAHCERGTQLVELAVVLPLLLVMFGAVAEFGRFFFYYQTLTKATRAGARYLSTERANGESDGDAAELVVYGNTEGEGDPVLDGLSVDHVEIIREKPTPGAAQPDRVTVAIDGYTYEPLFDLGALVGNKKLSLKVEMSPSTTMRMLSTIPS